MADESYAPRSPDLSAYARPIPQPPSNQPAYSPSYSTSHSQYSQSTYYPQSPNRYANYNPPHTPYTSAYAAQSPSTYTPSSNFYHSQSQSHQSYNSSSTYTPNRESYAEMPPVTRRSAGIKKEESIDSHQQQQSIPRTPKVKKEETLDRHASHTQKVKREIQDEVKTEQEEKPLFAGIEVKTKFPVARIKRIMQADEDVGKVAQITPTAVSKALELFMISLVTQSADIARAKSSKKITAQHIKAVVRGTESFDFLADIIGKIPDVAPKEKEENGQSTGLVKKKRKQAVGSDDD